jgi:hypothetical protein
MKFTRNALRTAKRLQVCLIPPLLATVAGGDCLRHVIAREACPATEAVALQFRGLQTISDLSQEAFDFLGIA